MLLCLALLLALAGQQQPAAPQVVVSAEHPPAPRQARESSSQPGEPGPPDTLPSTPVAAAEREAAAVVAWDLDLHLTPAAARLDTHARLTVRNLSGGAVRRLPLDLSGTLRWQSVALAGPGGVVPLRFTQAPVASDTDHIGFVEEAVVTLPEPLAPGAQVELTAFYGGPVVQSGARLPGASAERVEESEWDAIAPTSDAGSTALRGFGNVLWYPVIAPLAVLGDGNRLFTVVERERLRESRASLRLHLTVEYAGDPPNAAILNGRLEPLTAVPDDSSVPVDASAGVATASFAAAAPGLNGMSLFLTAQPAEPTHGELVDVVSARPGVAEPYVAAAGSVAALLGEWLGPTPLAPMLLVDHAGEPFADGALLVGRLAAGARPPAIAPLLVAPLTHAWFRSAQPWLAEGLAEWMRLLWTERQGGRAAALQELDTATHPLALLEPDDPATDAGQPLVRASSPLFLRGKAAAVWVTLRALTGDEALHRALVAYRDNTVRNPSFDRDPEAFERTLEQASGKDLRPYFDDWVYHDRGLPDLSVVQVTPRPLPARPGRNAGYLVAVEVRNDGGAVAEVPVTVRAGTAFSVTERLQIPAHSSASTRVLFESTPETVEVNDGSVPEQRSSTHVQAITLPPSGPG